MRMQWERHSRKRGKYVETTCSILCIPSAVFFPQVGSLFLEMAVRQSTQSFWTSEKPRWNPVPIAFYLCDGRQEIMYINVVTLVDAPYMEIMLFFLCIPKYLTWWCVVSEEVVPPAMGGQSKVRCRGHRVHRDCVQPQRSTHSGLLPGEQASTQLVMSGLPSPASGRDCVMKGGTGLFLRIVRM